MARRPLLAALSLLALVVFLIYVDPTVTDTLGQVTGPSASPAPSPAPVPGVDVPILLEADQPVEDELTQPDQPHFYALPQGATGSVTITPGSDGLAVRVILHQGAVDGPIILQTDGEPGQPVTISLNALPPDVYFIEVVGIDGATGPITVTLQP